ncbi:MAG: hypothetical protein MRJ93_05320 [Nitrososphaeraceae archaeon]|nr:hypothetical protein [Nitrososphaeraceae archaeon]
MSFSIDTPGVIRGILEGLDIEQLQEIEDKLFEGVDKERLLDSALNLLKNLDFEELNEESIPDSWDYLQYGVFLYNYRHSYNLTTMFFLELLIIGVCFGFGSQ